MHGPSRLGDKFRDRFKLNITENGLYWETPILLIQNPGVTYGVLQKLKGINGSNLNFNWFLQKALPW